MFPYSSISFQADSESRAIGNHSGGHRVSAIVTVQNDGLVADRYALTLTTSGGTAGGVVFTNDDITVTDVATGLDVSAAVRAGTYQTPVIYAGSLRKYKVEMTAPVGIAPGTYGGTTIKMYSATQPSGTEDRVYLRGWVQGISKLQYSLDEGTTWADVPQEGQAGYPLTVDQGSYVDFKAIKVLPNQEWPEDKPIWSGSNWSGDIGEQSWEYFDECSANSGDLKTVQVECGNIMAAKVFVTPRYQLYIWSDDDEILAGGQPMSLATTTLYALVLNNDDAPVQGVTVSFSSRYADGTKAGDINTSSPNDDNGITNSEGIAQVQLTSGRLVSEANITVTTSDLIGPISESAKILFAQSEAEVNIGAWSLTSGIWHAPCTITVDYDDILLPYRAIDIEVTATDSTGNVVPDVVTAPEDSGDTSSSGVFTTTLEWTGDGAPPSNYIFDVDVFDQTID